MPRKFGFALALLMMSAAPAMAGTSVCGEEPVGPAMPSQAEVMQKPVAESDAAVNQAYQDIKSWQKQLGQYRKCLAAAMDEDKRDLADVQQRGGSDKQDQVDNLNSDISAADTKHNASVNDETEVATEFNTLWKSYCSRPDAKASSCPKK